MATTVSGSRLVSDELEARAIAWRRHLHANPELSVRGARDSRRSSRRRSARSATSRSSGRRARRSWRRLKGAPAREGRRPPRRHGRAADPRGERPSVRLDAARRDARLRPRRPHRDAAGCGAAPRRAARRARGRGALRLPARRGASARRGARCRRGRCRRGASLVAGVHLLSGLETGQVSSLPGPVMAAADLFTLEIVGRGGPRREPARDRRPGRRGRPGDHEPAADRRPRDAIRSTPSSSP